MRGLSTTARSLNSSREEVKKALESLSDRGEKLEEQIKRVRSSEVSAEVISPRVSRALQEQLADGALARDAERVRHLILSYRQAARERRWSTVVEGMVRWADCLVPWAVVIAVIAVLGYVAGTTFWVGGWFGLWADMMRDSSQSTGARWGAGAAWLASAFTVGAAIFYGGRWVYERYDD